MRYELTDYERAVIKPMLPNKSRGGLVRLALTTGEAHNNRTLGFETPADRLRAVLQ